MSERPALDPSGLVARLRSVAEECEEAFRDAPTIPGSFTARWQLLRDAAAEIASLRTRLSALEADRERLEKALRFYADPDSWELVDVLGRCPMSGDWDDLADEGQGSYGKAARSALRDAAPFPHPEGSTGKPESSPPVLNDLGPEAGAKAG